MKAFDVEVLRAPRFGPSECPACGDEYLADCMTWLGQVCYPPSTDHPVAGHAFEIPAWCATQRRFLDEDGAE